MRNGIARIARYPILMVLAFACAVAANPLLAQGDQRVSITTSCTAARFGHLMSIDLRKLRAVRHAETPGQPTEGSEITVFRDGKTVRAIRFEDFGETGKVVTTVYLQDDASFLAWREDVTYRVPLYVSPAGEVLRIVRDVILACGLESPEHPSSDRSDLVIRVTQVLRKH